MQYKYIYSRRAVAKIRSFYGNVARKYRHTYSFEDIIPKYPPLTPSRWRLPFYRPA